MGGLGVKRGDVKKTTRNTRKVFLIPSTEFSKKARKRMDHVDGVDTLLATKGHQFRKDWREEGRANPGLERETKNSQEVDPKTGRYKWCEPNSAKGLDAARLQVRCGITPSFSTLSETLRWGGC